MSIARSFIDRPILTSIPILSCIFGGLWAFATPGRLEDPAFTIGQAVVVTECPGASAEEVAMPRLPDGACARVVDDRFGDVFGVCNAITAPGFDDSGTHRIATCPRREILAIEGVADVSVGGLPEVAILVDAIPALHAAQNVSPLRLRRCHRQCEYRRRCRLGRWNGARTRIACPEGPDSVREIAGQTIDVGGQVLNLIDFADMHRARVETPSRMIRCNGQEATTLGIAGLSAENIIDLGQRVDARLAAVQSSPPVGEKPHPIHGQHDLIDDCSQASLLNLAMSVGIIVVDLAVTMG